MLRVMGLLFSAALVTGVVAAPTSGRAETAAKSQAAKSSDGKAGSVDEFEENRRAHMSKSKENNAKKGAE